MSDSEPEQIDETVLPPVSVPVEEEESLQTAAPQITPEVSLDLRIRWLETLVYGNKQDAKEKQNAACKKEGRNPNTLVRDVNTLQQRLSAIVQNNEGLRRFMDHCESPHLLARNSSAHHFFSV